jgi:hypothetical protein
MYVKFIISFFYSTHKRTLLQLFLKSVCISIEKALTPMLFINSAAKPINRKEKSQKQFNKDI